jgi:hypothetical protein
MLKVAGSIPDEVIGFFSWPNLSSRTLILESIQPLTEMSTGNLQGGKGRPVRKADTSPPSVSGLSRRYEDLDVLQRCGPPRPVTEIILPIFMLIFCK